MSFIMIGNVSLENKAPTRSIASGLQKLDKRDAWSKTKAVALTIFASIAVGLFSLANFLWAWVPRCFPGSKHESFFKAIKTAQIQKLTSSLEIDLSADGLGKLSVNSQNNIDSFQEKDLRENITATLQKQNESTVLDAENNDQAATLARRVIALRTMIQNMKKTGKGNVEAVREKIAQCMNLPIFLSLADSKECIAVNFLQVLAVKLVATDASDALYNYGKTCLGIEDTASGSQIFTPEELADKLSRAVRKQWWNIDNVGWRVLWTAVHPEKVLHGLSSHIQPLQYDSSKNNPSFSAHSFAMPQDVNSKGKQMTFYYGPGPTGNVLFQLGLLPWYNKMGVFELRFNHQTSSSKSDHDRIAAALAMTNDQHKHVLISLDKKNTEKKVFSELSKGQPSIGGFLQNYHQKIKNQVRVLESRKSDNGVYIPAQYLDDTGLNNACSAAEEFCTKLSCKRQEEAASFWSEMLKGFAEEKKSSAEEKKSSDEEMKSRKRMGKMMMLISDAILSLGVLYKSLEKVPSEKALDSKLDSDLKAFRVSGACKQDVDRAIVENILLRLFFKWSQNAEPLTEREVCEIAGAVIGRAQIVDRRVMHWRRYQILNDVLRFIKDKDGVKLAHNILNEYKNKLTSSPLVKQPDPSFTGKGGEQPWVKDLTSSNNFSSKEGPEESTKEENKQPMQEIDLE